MNNLNLNHFMEAATGNSPIVVEFNSSVPTLVKATNGINGRMLSLLSHIPLLKNISFVKSYVEKVEIQNKTALLLFINALSKRFNVKSAETALEFMGSLKDKSLNERTMKSLFSIAENMYGKGDAKPLARQVIIRVWEYKGFNHPGHASVSIKNSIDPDKKFIKEHVSWWPNADSEGILDNFSSKKVQSLDNYLVDKYFELSERTRERLNAAELARKEIRARSLEPVDIALTKEAAFFPKAAQKKDRYGNWGISAQKVYFPMIGKNKDLLSEDKKNSKFILFGLDEKSILNDAQLVKDEAKENKIGYTFISTAENCAAIAARMLRSGGAENFVPFSSAWLYEDPNKVHEYAKSVQKEIDQLNHKADNIANYSKNLLESSVIRNEWNKFAKTEAGEFFITQKSIDELKNQLEKETNPVAIKNIEEKIRGHHQNHIESIHTRFKEQIASLTQTDKKRLTELAKAMDKYKPEEKDNVSILTKKARELVEAANSLITNPKDTKEINYNPVILTTYAMIKKLEELMAMTV